MPIKINVPFEEKEEAKTLGAWWFADEKTWLIPNTIVDINPFAKWLPHQEGFIVKWPHPVIKSSRICWKCHKETPLIALGSKLFYALEYITSNESKWTLYDYPVLFTDIDTMNRDLIGLLQQKYPFFQLTYSKTAQGRYWANTCIHCKSLQGDNYNFMEYNGIFNFTDAQDASLIERDYLKMKFDYYINAGWFQNESNKWIIK